MQPFAQGHGNLSDIARNISLHFSRTKNYSILGMCRGYRIFTESILKKKHSIKLEKSLYNLIKQYEK